ncbi:MAG: hypothetical protein QXM31_01200 [Candidatus Woesearchaeota archaeon]
MNITTAILAFVAAYLCYRIFRGFARKTAISSAYRREMYELLTNEKYQVKGRFD